MYCTVCAMRVGSPEVYNALFINTLSICIVHVHVGEYDYRRLQMRTRIQEMSRRPGFPLNLVFSEVNCFNDKMLATLRKKVKENINSAQLRGQKIMGGSSPHNYMVRETPFDIECCQLEHRVWSVNLDISGTYMSLESYSPNPSAF